MATVLWQEDDASLGAVETALRAAASQPAGPDAKAPRPRARALTLITVSDGEDERRADAIARLAVRHPLRAILVARLPADGGPALSARIRRHVHPGHEGLSIADELDLRVRGELSRHLGQLLSPLLLPELPVIFLWLGAPPLRDPVFAELRRLCDRGVVDLHAAADLPGDLAAIEQPATLWEVTWVRQGPLREHVASLFDPPEHRGAAASVRSAEIVHGPEGRLNACLMGGWIASRLGLPAGAVAVRADGSARRGVAEVVLLAGGRAVYGVRAADGGERVEIARPGADPERVRLQSLGAAEAVDRVLAGPEDPLWPPALQAAAAIAGRLSSGGN